MTLVSAAGRIAAFLAAAIRAKMLRRFSAMSGDVMASALTRRTLARVALALNARSGALLPALILMTDTKRLNDPLKAAEALPKGSAIILRHTEKKARARMAFSLRPIARRRDLILIVADDPELAEAIGADGL